MKFVGGSDVGVDDYGRRVRAVARKLVKLAGLSPERATELANSVSGCIRMVDDEGNLIFRNEEGDEVLRLPEKNFLRALR